jgi:hypothetical protein
MKEILPLGVLSIILAIPFFFISTALLRWLWNTTIPQVFGLKDITFWQAFRLMLISALLIGPGFRYSCNPLEGNTTPRKCPEQHTGKPAENPGSTISAPEKK